MPIRNWRTHPISEDLLLSERCSECQASANQWCVYTALPYVAQFHRPSPAQQKLIDRVGTPTKRCHNARYARARHKIFRQWMFSREPKPVPPPPSPDVLAALRGGQEFDRREREQLRAWLSVHWRLLAHANDGTDEEAP